MAKRDVRELSWDELKDLLQEVLEIVENDSPPGCPPPCLSADERVGNIRSALVRERLLEDK